MAGHSWPLRPGHCTSKAAAQVHGRVAVRDLPLGPAWLLHSESYRAGDSACSCPELARDGCGSELLGLSSCSGGRPRSRSHGCSSIEELLLLLGRFENLHAHTPPQLNRMSRNLLERPVRESHTAAMLTIGLPKKLTQNSTSDLLSQTSMSPLGRIDCAGSCPS